jgi:peptidoglycan/LPS O-acetylase OafA/YrhL
VSPSVATGARLPLPGASVDPRPASPDRFRPDIQGLRAVAVMLVVLYHLWPNRLSGGFIGVDVFFVISGYLITRHLAQEVDRTGRVSLLRFWARRARRLLPASLLVLLMSLLLAWAWLPETVWEDTVRQVRASALYVQNWALASDAVDYSAMNAEATVAQHYWSLSVEEQFYLVWPVVIVALLLLLTAWSRVAGRWSPAPRAALAAGLAVIGVVSLVNSIRLTAEDQAVAYFVTTTRVWEFAAGGLLGLFWTRSTVRGPVAPWLTWAGLTGIAVASYTFDEATAFPGSVALLPVLGSVLVLAAAPAAGRLGPTWLLCCTPARFLGDISYSLYLWHWPLIVVAPHVLDRQLDRWAKLMVFGLAVLLAWATTRLVEDPLRLGTLLRRTPVSLGFAAGGMAIVLVAGGFVLAQLPDTDTVAVPTSITSCVGPGALDLANQCPSVVGRDRPRPGPVQVMKQNRERVAYPGCQAGMPGSEPVTCDLGAPADAAPRTVALVGDSHATQWFPALDELGKQRGWRVRTFTKASCPATRAVRVIAGETTASNAPDCAAWVTEVREALAADPDVQAVFTAAYSTAYTFRSPAGVSWADPAVDGFHDVWGDWLGLGLEVYVLEEVPRTAGDYIPTCLAEHEDPLDCSVPVVRAMPEGRALSGAARTMGDRRVHLISLRDQFCDDQICYPVVGSLIVYRDYSHISREYAESLVPFIDPQVPRRPSRLN